MIGARGFVVGHEERVHLAQMQVRIDERLGGQAAPGVDLGCSSALHALADRGDAPAGDGDVLQRLAPAAQPGAPDDDVEGRHERNYNGPVKPIGGDPCVTSA